jgi:hypothetical protein
VISREDMTSLIWLRMHWENYYQISLDDGLWRALPVGGSADLLTAQSALQLRDAMKDDFAARAARERHAQLGIPAPGGP